MISRYDYLNIFFYLAMMVGIGVYFSRRNKNTSDYFRAGGSMPWWISGTAAWMGSFSAWTFTGAAGKIYETGPYVLCLYYAMILPLLVVFYATSVRFRRMRVVTPFEAIRLRFGPGSQQFYIWIRLPLLLFFSAVALDAVGVFMAAVFEADLTGVLIVLGTIVTLISLAGGSFAVVASDFVQMFLVVTVAITTAVLVLAQPAVGGIEGLISRVPPADFHWGAIARPEFILFWFVALTVNNLFTQNNIDNSTKYLMAANDREARLMPLIPIAGAIVGPLIWMIPPMGAAITHPDLHRMFPNLKYPHEAAFLASALDVLPRGMLGLLICGIFAATLTALDASLNQGAGIFVRNFYLPVVNPECGEKKLLRISKVCTAIFGCIIILMAIFVGKFRSSGLFDLLNQLGISLLLPMTLPLFIGLFWKRTPAWSTWTTVLLGLAISVGVRFCTRPEMISGLPGFAAPFKPEEVTSYYIFATVACVTVICTGWFFFSSLFYNASPASYRESVEEFFARLHQPIVTMPETVSFTQYPVLAMIGKVSLLYGLVLTGMVLIPNTITGRACYLASGGLMAGVGFLLVRKYRSTPLPSKMDRSKERSFSS